MKRWLFLSLVCLLGNPSVQAADEFYINNGSIFDAPQIDAINFLNNGTINIFTSAPFETANTLNFTNTGVMFGSPGWRLDNGPASDGQRRWAANFVNRGDGQNNGVIQASDPGQAIFIGGPNIAPVAPSYLLVSATNIVSQGLLSVGANGWLQLDGANVNLSRSGVEVQPIVPQGSFNDISNFFPEVAIEDLYWAQTNATFNSGSIWNGQVASDPISGVRVFNPIADLWTNAFEGIMVTVTNIDTNGMAFTTDISVPTNIIRQAVFVGATDTNVEVEIRFFASSIPTNELKTVSVGLSVGSSNLVTTFPETTTLYFVDYLASETNRGVLGNYVTTTTFRPANYLVSRAVPFEFFFGFPGFGPPPNDFLYSQSFSNNAVLGDFAAYGMFVNNTVSQPPAVPGGIVTNLPGRVRIFADNLNLNKARFRGEGQISIEAKHLIGSTNAVVDCENLFFNLGSTNGDLHVLNLAKESVTRLKGDAFAWSGLWTNTLSIVLTNYAIDTNMMTTNRMDITNSATVLIHTLILDATPLVTLQPVTVHDFATHSTNVLFSDAMTIAKSFLIDGDSFTLDGSITLTGTIEDWRYINAPNLRFLTNNGILNIANEGHFGDDRLASYSTFVNRGTNAATGLRIRSSYFENSGTLSAGSGGVIIQTSTGKIENGTINSVADVQIFANDLKFDRGGISTSSRLDLTVANSLFDTGAGSGNRFSCRGGVRLLVKPQTSDLIGTTIISRAARFAEVGHVWAGQDRGSDKAGFTNNAAIGQLRLSPEGFDALFTFSGASVGNALYVDLLDLTLLTDFNNQLQIDPNLVIYFAAAKLNSAPPNLPSGVEQLPEEYLDGQFDGRLRWVREFAGPNSSVDVLINGQTVQVNRALRNSKIIDSDGDGIPNFYDFTPFDGPGLIVTAALVQTNQPPSTVVLISWEAAPATVYNFQSASSFLRPDWQTLLRVTNNSLSNKIITISDTNISAGVVQRFYRVGYGN